VYIDNSDTKRNIGYNVSLEKFDADRQTETLMAHSITCGSAACRWTIRDNTARVTTGRRGSMEQGAARDTTLETPPRRVDTYDNVFTAMDTHELNQRIAKEETRGTGMMTDLLLEKYKRYVGPFSAYILTLMGVSLSSKKVRGGIGLSLGIGIALSFTFLVLVQF